MTPEEHFKFVCEMKDMPVGEVQAHVNEILNLVMLAPHRMKHA
eukprot:CAMPEP_0202974682 /NCGR_PEP_ID=MMETSP1396-20130829/62758_1 /ASSEMBLY_ACC=CAM_ASM_000872 /TAXON_ID= /ORGANISM="Pseudokeronopsis sp., Strain Brazil" /LENGTH=42 /DNA_ID= /DNA_START= /DNA_END= /DNA_ORIENTATION=